MIDSKIDLPFKEGMKQHLKTSKYWDMWLFHFKPKKHSPYMDDWCRYRGLKPHSHNWGRKPNWKKEKKNPKTK
ncbi:hypothetical protein [Bacillus velezensis]|uniref:hypothetical protein n=1 Tax=Bacillus velezensis TaxID=492670 RepID=UPI001A92C642|nr:hypothetical protein [Bacillus velezensis]